MDFFTSDLHWGHKNIIKFCNRPFKNVHDMNRSLVKNWNSVVTNNDTVYVIGDVFVCNPSTAAKYIKKLNGRKILIKGNHDHDEKTMLGVGFDEFHRKLDYRMPNGKNALLQHYPAPSKLIKKYDMLIHGHIHIAPKVRENRVNVSCDIWDYTPVSIEEICKLKLDNKKPVDEWCEIYTDGEILKAHLSIHVHDFSSVVEHIYEMMKDRWPRRRK